MWSVLHLPSDLNSQNSVPCSVHPNHGGLFTGLGPEGVCTRRSRGLECFSPGSASLCLTSTLSLSTLFKISRLHPSLPTHTHTHTHSHESWPTLLLHSHPWHLSTFYRLYSVVCGHPPPTLPQGQGPLAACGTPILEQGLSLFRHSVSLLCKGAR